MWPFNTDDCMGRFDYRYIYYYFQMINKVKTFVFFLRMDFGEEPQVKVAANVFRELCYSNRDSVSAGILVAGWDKINGGQVCKTRQCISWYTGGWMG